MKIKYLVISTLLIFSACSHKISERTLRQCKVHYKIDRIITDMDPDGNSIVNQDEYMDYLTGRFNKSDANHDKIHSKKEFMEMFMSNYVRKDEKLTSKCWTVGKRIKKKGSLSFKIIDLNKNGDIDYREFVEKHRRIFEYVDINNNNLLEYEELFVFML